MHIVADLIPYNVTAINYSWNCTKRATVFNATFSSISTLLVTVSFIDGGNLNTREKMHTCCKSLTDVITWCCNEYISSWVVFELTTLLVIGTDCMRLLQINYHAITSMTAHIIYYILTFCISTCSIWGISETKQLFSFTQWSEIFYGLAFNNI